MSKGGEHGIRLHVPAISRPLRFVSSNQKGQAIVEFTLIFVLLLVIAWIPADFGLAFYTGQLALNASREGARIAAADPRLVSEPLTGSCNLPPGGTPCGTSPVDNVLEATAARLSSALMPGATITVSYPVAGGGSCDNQVRVRVNGSYNFFFFQLLRLLGFSVNDTVNIDYWTDMRWEHQC